MGKTQAENRRLLNSLNKSINGALKELKKINAYHGTHPVMHAYNLGFHSMAQYLDSLLTKQKNLNAELNVVKTGEQVP